ncbi:hypothetical protein M0R72_16070 [Candidatus Pacearchaeota archaeon]|jgi:hypothetical protein|nr:hypothetical protein [Candidatus Pacearchaeota archaeon]
MNFKFFLICLFFVLLLSNIENINASSNASIEAKNSIEIARGCLDYFVVEEIPSIRANETFNEALQIYETKIFYENTGNKVDFSLVNEYSQEVCSIKDFASRARDELNIFLEYYNNSAERFDLSEMDEEYNAILNSYYGERFEETSSLINGGYSRISEIESSQTTLNLFYKTTTQTLKNFFINNWIQIIISLVSLFLVFFISRTSINLFSTLRKIKRLELEKKSLFELIKKTQEAYFTSKTMSEIEFSVKIKTFKNMIRDIDRRIPELREKLIKLKRDKDITKRRK